VGFSQQSVAVIDGVEGKVYEYVRDLTFSPGGKHSAYAASRCWLDPTVPDGSVIVRPDDAVIVLDGVEGKSYEFIEGGLCISANGNHVAFVQAILSPAQGDWKYRVVMDGKEGRLYDHIDWMQFSPDGQRVAYVVRRKDDNYLVVVGDKEGKIYDYVDGTRLRFSPDSRRVAYVAFAPYVASQDSREFNVIDGKEGPKDEEVGGVHFGVDSRHFYYKMSGNGNERYVTHKGEGKEYKCVDDFQMSPDGEHIAYQASSGDFFHRNDAFVVRDGKEGKSYFSVCGDSLRFTADGKHLEYMAWSRPTTVDGKLTQLDDGKKVVVVDGLETFTLDFPTQFVVSPDGRHTAYLASDKDKKELVVVDGVASKTGASQHGFESKLVFDGSNRLNVMTVREKKLVRIEIEIREK
jgi:WD40-like Beta Propeller Repeat